MSSKQKFKAFSEVAHKQVAECRKSVKKLKKDIHSQERAVSVIKHWIASNCLDYTGKEKRIIVVLNDEGEIIAAGELKPKKQQGIVIDVTSEVAKRRKIEKGFPRCECGGKLVDRMGEYGQFNIVCTKCGKETRGASY